MKLNAAAVATKDMSKSLAFYKILGFNFPENSDSEPHVESMNSDGIKLMLDSEKIIEGIIDAKPKASNHSSFALEYDAPEEIDHLAQLLKQEGFKVFKSPWKAFWGQYYCVVEDPFGYKVDLYCNLK